VNFGRGFASPNYKREKADQARKAGNRAARAKGQVPQWTPEQAKAAGVKGGQISAARRRERKAQEEQKAA
jgi:hypothetical protein